MASKYRLSPRERWSMNHDVRMSDHAADRWDERTPAGSISPEAAFEHADEVEHPELLADRTGHVPDSAHVYNCHDYRVAFIVDDGTIQTVLSLDGVSHGPSRSYLMSHGPHPEVDEVTAGGRDV